MTDAPLPLPPLTLLAVWLALLCEGRPSAVTTQPDDDRPEYLRRLFPKKEARASSGHHQPLRPDQAKPYAAKAFNAEVEELARTPQGSRNGQLNVAAFNLSQLVAGGYLEHDQVWDTLRSTALAIGLTGSETEATLRSAFQAGERQPRLVAELDDYTPPPATVLHLAPVADGDGTADEEDEVAAPDWGKRFPALDWHELWADKTEDEWIAEPLIPARRLVALFSAPKMGKSLLMLELAVQVNRGMPVLGASPTKPVVVLYVDFENDPRGDVRSRLQAMGYGPEHLGNLKYLSFPQLAYLDTYIGGLELLAVAQHYGAVLVVIDTISRAVQGEENDNDTWLGFYRNTGRHLKAAGIACVRLDHTGKDASKGMRGGSAKYGDVDAVWAMTQLTDDTFRLECTANRLPITEKLLTVKRKEGPLRHVLDLAGLHGAALECCHVLDGLGVPAMATHDQIAQALEDAGHVFGRNVRARAYHHRRELARAVNAGPTVLEDK